MLKVELMQIESEKKVPYIMHLKLLQIFAEKKD